MIPGGNEFLVNKRSSKLHKGGGLKAHGLSFDQTEGGCVQKLGDFKKPVHGQGRLSRFQFAIGILRNAQLEGHKVLRVGPVPP
jgi:hypothetical protein